METCPACGERAITPWRAATPASPGLLRGDGYLLLRCSRCGTAALAADQTLPPEEKLYEEGTYRPTRPSFDRLLEWFRRVLDRERLHLLGGVSAGERTVEVGAGRGRLLAKLQGVGVEAVGIEPSPGAASAARARGARVENCSLDDAVIEPASKDLVVLWHVLEHLEQPASALERTRSWIADGGRIVIATPNLASLQARLAGDRWFHQDVPRHRTLFTVEGLVRLLRRSGFAPIRSRQVMIDQSLLGMWLALLNRLTCERDVPFRFLKRDLSYPRRREAVSDAAITLIAGPILIPVAVLLELLAALSGRGGNIVIEAYSTEPIVRPGAR